MPFSGLLDSKGLFAKEFCHATLSRAREDACGYDAVKLLCFFLLPYPMKFGLKGAHRACLGRHEWVTKEHPSAIFICLVSADWWSPSLGGVYLVFSQ